MRLLVVSSWFPYPPDNGSKLRAYHLLRELAKHHVVNLLAFAEPHEQDHIRTLGALCETVRLVLTRASWATRPLETNRLLSPVPRAFAQRYSTTMERYVREALPTVDAGVALQVEAALHLEHTRTLPRVFDEAELTILREQFTTERHVIRRARQGLTWWKFGRFMRRLVGRFERTTVVSEAEGDQLARLGCDMQNVVVVPNGAVVVAEGVASRYRRDTLIYPGALTYKANFDAVRSFLAEVFPRIRATRPDTTLIVTGALDGVPLSELPNVEGVTFTGYIPDIDRAIAESAACIVPLRIGGGTRLKVLQSMAVGTPVVSTSKGVEGLAVTPENDVLIGDQPEELARQTIRVLEDQELRGRLSIRGRQLVQERYSWEQSGRRLDDAILAAVENARERSTNHGINSRAGTR